MKQTLLTLSLLFCFLQYSSAQISYTGCTDAIPGNYPYTLNLSGTVDDGGDIRNTYQNTPATCDLSSTCVFRIRWNTTNVSYSRWELRASDNGGATFPNLLYFNDTASLPNPPDLTLGIWVDNLGNVCGGDGSVILSGDVQSIILGVNQFEVEQNINLYPNPTSDLINISGLKNKANYTIYGLLGDKILKGTISDNRQIDVKNVSNGLYFLKFENGNTIKFIKE